MVFPVNFARFLRTPFLRNASEWLFLFLQQLLALYFAIIYRWQLSSSSKSLVREKHSFIYFKGFTELDILDIFSIFSYAKRMLTARKVSKYWFFSGLCCMFLIFGIKEFILIGRLLRVEIWLVNELWRLHRR